jgi:peptidoglycan hydrolase CwlO-like protein
MTEMIDAGIPESAACVVRNHDAIDRLRDQLDPLMQQYWGIDRPLYDAYRKARRLTDEEKAQAKERAKQRAAERKAKAQAKGAAKTTAPPQPKPAAPNPR